MIVILLGPPGVGKGTQGKLLCERMGLEHLSTGDLLRAARREGTDLGKQAQSFMDRGELVPDDVIVGMVREELRELGPEAGVVFDGFPRTVPQAESLDRVLTELGRKVDRVVVLSADDEVLVKRLSGRRSCPECGSIYNVHFSPPDKTGVCDQCGHELVHRADDTPETVQNRLDVYREQTAPLITHYEQGEASVRHVDGSLAVDEVQDAMKTAITGSEG